MIKNEIKHIISDEIENITAQAKADNYYIANLDGRTIHNEQEYIKAIYKGFILPEEYNYNLWESYHGYHDCITDLGWLIEVGYKGFVLIIDYYNYFLANEPVGKHYLEGRKGVVNTFKEYLEIEGFLDITKYWKYEVLECTNCKIPHSFNIYLVDR